MSKGLEGLLVLDLSSLLPGPYCTSLLQSMGAEVWKIERPGSGDPSRSMPESFANLNWGKRSITLDFRKPEGIELFKSMVKKADIIVENFRPGVVGRLGIDYNEMQKVNPGIIYCSISGYGQEGPYRDKPAHDINIQALCSSLSTNIKEGEDPEPILPIGDLSAGVFAALGILNALFERQTRGKGSYLDISMADGPLTWATMSQLVRVKTDSNQEEQVLDSATPHYGVFETRDRKYIALGIVYEDHLWKNLCKVLEKTQWADMNHKERIQQGLELREDLRVLFREKDRDEWIGLLKEVDVPVTPVQTLEEAHQNPQFMQRGIIKHEQVDDFTVPLTKNPASPSEDFTVKEGGVPELGEHTFELLERLGYEKDELERLNNIGVF